MKKEKKPTKTKMINEIIMIQMNRTYASDAVNFMEKKWPDMFKKSTKCNIK